jgi:hypothetical protein
MGKATASIAPDEKELHGTAILSRVNDGMVGNEKREM